MNKRFYSLTILFCAFGFMAMAQRDLQFGFQASPTFSWLSTDATKISGNGTNVGMRLGVLAEIYFRPDYAITTGIGFAFNQGGTLRYGDAGSYWPKSDLPEAYKNLPAGANLKYGIQYVEVPLGLKLRSKEMGYIKYYVEPFTTFGFESQAKGTIKASGLEKTDKLAIRREVNSLAFSLGAGAGIEYSISQSNSIIGGVYFQRIITDITDDSGSDNSKAVGSSITLRIGLLF